MSAGDWKDLYRATEEGDFALVRFHVTRGVNLNYQHPEILMTVLVTAIKNGHSDIAVYFLENGADPRIESYFDQLTPLTAAMKYRDQRVLEKLAELGIRPSFWQKILSR